MIAVSSPLTRRRTSTLSAIDTSLLYGLARTGGAEAESRRAAVSAAVGARPSLGVRIPRARLRAEARCISESATVPFAPTHLALHRPPRLAEPSTSGRPSTAARPA